MHRLLATVSLLLCLPAHALEWEENPQVGALFEGAEVTGTFVLFDVAEQRFIGHNRSRAETRYLPASTFKIPHTLIGLSVGAVRNVDEVLPYGGAPQPFETWERDMGLREAIAVSNVPIYQALARRIGLERMRASVTRLEYGNGEIGDRVDEFWLRGPLKISAVEQVRFLTRLATGALPFPPDAQAKVREILLTDAGDGWKLYSKTGWESAPGPGIGWWVGWVRKGAAIHAFALNMDMRQSSDAGRRVELGKASLRALGVMARE